MSPKLLNSLLAIASFALYYLFINPLYTGVGSVWQPEQGVGALRTKSAQYDTTIAQVQSLSVQARALQKQYSNISPETIQKMDVMVPDQVDPVRLMSEINTIANEAGFVLGDLTVSENQVTKDGRGSYLISFSVTTSYTRFKELMRNYETSMRLFTIKSINFSAPAKPGETVAFQVKLETFYMK